MTGTRTILDLDGGGAMFPFSFVDPTTGIRTHLSSLSCGVRDGVTPYASASGPAAGDAAVPSINLATGRPVVTKLGVPA